MKNISLLFGATALLFACSPTEFQVKREITIDAPKDIVFTQVNDHHKRDAWSPWEKMDPEMTKTYEGANEGEGAIYKWNGNEDVGSGMLTIVKSDPNNYIKSELVFTEPMETSSTVEWNFTDTENSTKAEWIISGELPGYLFWMGQEDMDEAMGEDLEAGLESLKLVSEQMASQNQNSTSDLTAELIDVEGKTYFYIGEEVPFDALNSAFFSSRFGQIMTYLGEDSEKMTGAPFTVYHVWDNENQTTTLEVAISCESEKPGNDNIKKGQTYTGNALMCSYKGDYEGTEQAHYFLHDYIKQNNMRMDGSPWEVYVSDPAETNPEELITEIYYPVTIDKEE